ncbi:MAG: Ldh family oxidoreductase [Planctomycetaceae bacterium]
MTQPLDHPQDANQEVRIAHTDLRTLLVKIYVRLGMFQAEAQIAADRQVEADLRGLRSHGSRAAIRHAQAMDVGDVDPRGQTLMQVQTPAVAVLDGGRNLGHVAATKAIKLAMEMARGVGTGTVAVRNSHHLGAASVYTLLAAREGLIAYCATNTGRASVAAHGSKQAATANNAFSWAAPTRSGIPFCLDMSCASTSWSKVESLRIYGGLLPGEWALDGAGHPTNDPQQAKVLLPAAGPRGFGLAWQCSLLAGPLVGGKMPIQKTRHAQAEDSEHFFYVLDVSRFGHIENFYNQLDDAARQVRELTPERPDQPVCLPGDIEHRRAEAWSQEGIPLHRGHVTALEELADRYKIPVPWRSSAGAG